MALSTDLISQFVKITNDDKKKNTETTVYGTIVKDDGRTFVKIDGSDTLTPVSSTTNTFDGERVTVMIKNHSAVVTGNLSSPSVRADDIKDMEDVSAKIAEFEILIADKVSAEAFSAEVARIDELKADYADLDTLISYKANVEDLEAEIARIDKIETDKLDATAAAITYATIEGLMAIDADIYNLQATYATVAALEAANAEIDKLNANKLSADEAAITYANIDFSNIGSAAMEYFYAHSGLIENVTVADGTITGRLVGVTIVGDLIEGGTIVAEKLVIQGEDGLYYKLNTDGETTSAEQTEYNSLNGQVILAKSITATQISVSDLVAFDATIGGFNITNNSIFSEVKDDEGNTARGIYMDTDGQFNFGDETNFVKYYRDEDGSYKLAISAESILYALNGKQYSIADLGHIGEYVHIGTYENEPCIELGESDSDFKLIITNTRILFMEGTAVPAYINNQSLHITKAVIEEEIQQGEFVWKVRQNGNMGLMWKGEA